MASLRRSLFRACVRIVLLALTPALTAQETSPLVRDLIARMTLEEKASQCVMDCPAIPRLGIRAYHWWNECLHGVGRAGSATVFPQALGLAATFDAELMEKIGVAVSTEARAKHRPGADSPQYGGLTFWTPTINLARDPRWGRTEETYGEDPFLTTRIAVAYVRGLQGDDPRRLRTAACAKHFAVHSQELRRERKDVVVDDRDLFEHYLPAFEALVREAKVAQVMTAYNAVNGSPCTGHPRLIPLLRDGFGFRGTIVSDVGAPDHVHDRHRFRPTYPEGAAWALQGGVDILSPNDATMPQWLVAEVRAGRLAESALDRALAASLGLREKLGLFDAPGTGPFDGIPLSVVGSDPHRALARAAAEKSFVLIKNDGVTTADPPILPLGPGRKEVVVCGPFAERVEFGGYSGTPTHAPPTPFEALRSTVPPDFGPLRLIPWKVDAAGQPQVSTPDLTAIVAARVVVACLGTGPEFEDENKDRDDLNLPAVQAAFLQRLVDMNPAVVVITSSGGPLSVPLTQKHVPAWLQIWYPGQEGPQAVADVLLGRVSPSGRMPITVPVDVSELPPFEDYAFGNGRTYRYFKGKALVPFGHGLSYAKFRYLKLEVVRRPAEADADTAQVTLENRDDFGADEVVQVYARVDRLGTIATPASRTTPGRESAASRPSIPQLVLLGFARAKIPARTTVALEIRLPRSATAAFDESTKALHPRFRVRMYEAGPSSNDLRLTAW